MATSSGPKGFVLFIVAIAVGLGIALSMQHFGIAPFFRQGDNGDNEDRPPIIVRDGSVILDGGDSTKAPDTWKDWTPAPTAATHYRPKQPKGAPVNGFLVTVVGADQGQCPTPSMEGDFITIEFTEENGTKSQLHVMRSRKTSNGNGKWEPEAAPPLNQTFSTPIPQTNSAPGQLVYGQPGTGWVSNVTVDDVSCGFNKPANGTDRNAVRVTIQPEK